MSNQDTSKQPMRPKRLPGRAYTLFVTGLATILIAVPWIQSQHKVWKASAIVQHVPLETGRVKSVVSDNLQLAIDQVAATHPTGFVVPEVESLRSLTDFSTTETPDGKERLTTIQIRDENRQLSANIAGVLARELSHAASIGDQTAAVVSIESSIESPINRNGLLKIGAIALCLGAITLIYPRNRAIEKESVTVDQIESSTGLPTLGSVFPSNNPTRNQKASNTPLRVTVMLAEAVVAVAFLLMVFASTTNSTSTAELLGSPLQTYAETMRNFWPRH